MIFFLRVCGLVLTIITQTANADNVRGPAAGMGAETNLQIKEILKNKKFEDDKRITDLELKAQAGSLSRYSMKFDLGYNGPAVNRLYDPQRPNPDNRPVVNRTNIAGFIGARYRLSPDAALNASTGVRWFSPYHQVMGEHVEKPRREKDYEVGNPQLSYDRTYPVSGAQLRSSIKESVTTELNYQQRGQFANTQLGQAAKYNLGTSRVIVGGIINLDFFHYNREYRTSDGRVSNYYLNLIPSLEYKILDNLNFNTSVGYPYANLRSFGSWWTWEHQLSTWRVGVGWGITREIYINPYVNFFAESPAFNTASLSLNTVFSMF